MCHVNDALAYPSEGIAKQKSSNLTPIAAGHAFAASFQVRQASNGLDAEQRLVLFPDNAGEKTQVTRANDSAHGAQL